MEDVWMEGWIDVFFLAGIITETISFRHIGVQGWRDEVSHHTLQCYIHGTWTGDDGHPQYNCSSRDSQL